MKKDRFWRNLIIIMALLIFVPLVFMGKIDMKWQFLIMIPSCLGCLVLLLLMGIRYAKGTYTLKEFTVRWISLFAPYALFPVYTFIRVWIYYRFTHDNDPLGYLWVMEVLPQTLVFTDLGAVIVVVSYIIRYNKNRKGA